MGTRKTDQTAKKIDCKSCGHTYTPMCDYLQGRCPHHTALIDTTLFKTRLTNLINFFKGNNNGTN